MARITIEDCLKVIPNRYKLVILGFKRAKDILSGATPVIDSNNKAVVTSLREIAANKISYADVSTVEEQLADLGEGLKPLTVEDVEELIAQ